MVSSEASLEKRKADLLVRKNNLQQEATRLYAGMDINSPKYKEAKARSSGYVINQTERINADLSRINTRLEAYNRAKESGARYKDELKYLKKKGAKREYEALSPDKKRVVDDRRSLVRAQTIVRRADKYKDLNPELTTQSRDYLAYRSNKSQQNSVSTSNNNNVVGRFSDRNLKTGYYKTPTGKFVSVQEGGLGRNAEILSLYQAPLNDNVRSKLISDYKDRSYSSSTNDLVSGIARGDLSKEKVYLGLKPTIKYGVTDDYVNNPLYRRGFVGGYLRAEKKTSNFLKKRISEKDLDRSKIYSFAGDDRVIGELINSPRLAKVEKSFINFQRRFQESSDQDLLNRPLNFVGSYALGLATGGLGRGASILAKTGRLGRGVYKGFQAGAVGVGGAYVGGIGYDIYKTGDVAGVLGRETPSLIAFTGGYSTLAGKSKFINIAERSKGQRGLKPFIELAEKNKFPSKNQPLRGQRSLKPFIELAEKNKFPSKKQPNIFDFQDRFGRKRTVFQDPKTGEVLLDIKETGLFNKKGQSRGLNSFFEKPINKEPKIGELFKSTELIKEPKIGKRINPREYYDYKPTNPIDKVGFRSSSKGGFRINPAFGLGYVGANKLLPSNDSRFSSSSINSFDSSFNLGTRTKPLQDISYKTTSSQKSSLSTITGLTSLGFLGAGFLGLGGGGSSSLTPPKPKDDFKPTNGSFQSPFGFFSGNKKRGTGNKRSYSYAPSLVALEFGIKGKSKKKTRFTGLEFRGL